MRMKNSAGEECVMKFLRKADVSSMSSSRYRKYYRFQLKEPFAIFEKPFFPLDEKRDYDRISAQFTTVFYY